MDNNELVRLIEAFVEGSCGDWEWDDFISVPQKTPEMELVRKKILDIPEQYPPTKSGCWCSKEGMKVMLDISQSLRDILG